MPRKPASVLDLLRFLSYCPVGSATFDISVPKRRFLRDAERLGYAVYLNDAWRITSEGRAAIGAPLSSLTTREAR